jgi:hypothetical protein
MLLNSSAKIQTWVGYGYEKSFLKQNLLHICIT